MKEKKNYIDRRSAQESRRMMRGIFGKKVPGAAKPAGGDRRKKPKKK